MGFFGFGKKKDVKQEIASEIAVSALAYRFELGETNSRLCGHAAVEHLSFPCSQLYKKTSGKGIYCSAI
jgi:hypothetical protein